MPAIDQLVETAMTAPQWAWVAVAVGVVAILLADDRAGKLKSGADVLADLSRATQLFLGSAVVGFAFGFIYPPAELTAMVGGAL